MEDERDNMPQQIPDEQVVSGQKPHSPHPEIIERGADDIDVSHQTETRGRDVIDPNLDLEERGTNVIDHSRILEERGADVIDEGPKQDE